MPGVVPNHSAAPPKGRSNYPAPPGWPRSGRGRRSAMTRCGAWRASSAGCPRCARAISPSRRRHGPAIGSGARWPRTTRGARSSGATGRPAGGASSTAHKDADAAHVVVVNHVEAGWRMRPPAIGCCSMLSSPHRRRGAPPGGCGHDQLSFRADGFTLNQMFRPLCSKAPERVRAAGGDAQQTAVDRPVGRHLSDLAHQSAPARLVAAERDHRDAGQDEAARSRLDGFWSVIDDFVQDAAPRATRDVSMVSVCVTSGTCPARLGGRGGRGTTSG